MNGVKWFFIVMLWWFNGVLWASFSPLLKNDGTAKTVTYTGKKYSEGFIVLPVLPHSDWLTFARLPVYKDQNDNLYEHAGGLPGSLIDEKTKKASLLGGIEKVKTKKQKKDFAHYLTKARKWRREDEEMGRLCRLDCFYEMMGVHEIEFRGWSATAEPQWGKYPPLEKLRLTKDGFIEVPKNTAERQPFGRNALCGSRFLALSVGELEKNVIQLQKTFKPQVGGSFTLLDGYAIKDNYTWEKALKLTDITYLQAHNAGAVFQIASTFNALEGGMGKNQIYYGRPLESMQFKPTQGENAALSTMGATFIRKYILPPLNLLEGLGGKVSMNKEAAKSGLVWAFNKDLEPSDVKTIKVGLHADVVVTSGYYGCYSGFLSGKFSKIGGEATERIAFLEDRLVVAKGREPFFVFNSFIDLRKPEDFVRIDQVFTSALSLIEEKKGTSLQGRHITDNNAKMILEAAYKGTMYVAAIRAVEKINSGKLKGPQKVYLTLVGAGAFNNKVSWIVDLLTQAWFSDLINDFGLEVYLVIYPSPRKDREMAPEDLKLLRKLAEVTQLRITEKRRKAQWSQGSIDDSSALPLLAKALRQLAS